jgi:drug/metabolite transporter (DMT)-like permease
MKRSLANLLLLFAALIWGTTFVAQSLGMAVVGPFTFSATRFLLGAVVIMPLAWREYLQLRTRGVHITRKDLLLWMGLGVVLSLGVNLQQIGLITTTVSNAAILTALYVPAVPLLSWLLYRERVHAVVWLAILGSLVGIFLLSGGKITSLVTGDCWVLGSTVFWAFHVIWIGRVADRLGSPVLVAMTQFLVCSALSGIVALTTETITGFGLQAAMPTILYGGLLSVGIAYTLQVVAQRHTSPTEAAILLSSELLFGAVGGAIVLGDRLGPVQLAGGVLIFVSILIVQVLPSLRPLQRS